MDENIAGIQKNYDRIAAEYARRLFHELAGKPRDRELLDRFATEVKDCGRICDMGCGPGEVARYLRNQGAEVFGLDLSTGMIEQARRLNPDIPFQPGNMLALDLPDASLAGIAAFYAIVNTPREFLSTVFREMKRVVQPNGLLLLAFHVGEDVEHVEELFEQKVSMDFFFFTSEEIGTYLETEGWIVEEITERPPYAPEVEYQSHRSYIFARKP